MLSGLECECRQACLSRRDHPRSRFRCCGRCSGGRPHLGFWTAGIDNAILRNVIVVADALEASCLVAGFQGFYWEVLINKCGTAMYHDQIDFSWILHLF